MTTQIIKLFFLQNILNDSVFYIQTSLLLV